MKRVLGIDLSLTGTGLATIDDDGLHAWTFKSKLTGLARLRSIRAELAYQRQDITLVVLEGPSYGSQQGSQQGHHERAGLWWLVVERLDQQSIPVAVAPPKSLKKYATGKGNASKEQVLVAAAKRIEGFDGDNNAADAAWLALMGADFLGAPLVQVPVVQRDALDGVAWPDLRHTAGA